MNTALEYSLINSVTTGNYQLTKILLDQGVNPNIYNIGNRAPLHIAAGSDNLDIVTELLAHEANINIRGDSPYFLSNRDDRTDWTPLHYAIYRNKPECLNLLLKSGADISIVEFWDTPALEYVTNNKLFNPMINIILQHEVPVKGVHDDCH